MIDFIFCRCYLSRGMRKTLNTYLRFNIQLQLHFEGPCIRMTFYRMSWQECIASLVSFLFAGCSSCPASSSEETRNTSILREGERVLESYPAGREKARLD